MLAGRYFNGKHYKYMGTKNKKTDATREGKALREKGYLARIVPNPFHGYDIYAHK